MFVVTEHLPSNSNRSTGGQIPKKKSYDFQVWTSNLKQLFAIERKAEKIASKLGFSLFKFKYLDT